MEKVYLNTSDSDIFYHYQNYRFYFSSKATRERFIRKLFIYVEEETNKFINKYDVVVDRDSFNTIFAFILYNKTEKRGFKVENFVDNKKIKDIKEMPKLALWGECKDD